MSIQTVINQILNNMDFIKSNRFWAMVLGAIVIYLRSKQIIGAEEAVLFETVLAGFIGIRTIDRFSEKLGKQ